MDTKVTRSFVEGTESTASARRRVLIDIAHPAHVHFFRNPIAQLQSEGHEVLVTSRAKDCAIDLLDALNISHVSLGAAQSGIGGLAGELLVRNLKLLRASRSFKPDVMLAIGGIFIAQVGVLTRTPSVVFYDTEMARLQNLLTYPFANRVVVPRCYQGWIPANKACRYPGYHELSYLAPRVFRPNRKVAIENGLAPEGDTFLIRLVSWQANHDVGENGWNQLLTEVVVRELAAHGKVMISAEGDLPVTLESYRYTGAVDKIHHVMAYCRLHVGESATMVSESVVLGVPAIYAANTGRGYTTEQEGRYGLVTNIRKLDPAAIVQAIRERLGEPLESIANKHNHLLSDTCDVAELIAEFAHNPLYKLSSD